MNVMNPTENLPWWAKPVQGLPNGNLPWWAGPDREAETSRETNTQGSGMVPSELIKGLSIASMLAPGVGGLALGLLNTGLRANNIGFGNQMRENMGLGPAGFGQTVGGLLGLNSLATRPGYNMAQSLANQTATGTYDYNYKNFANGLLNSGMGYFGSRDNERGYSSGGMTREPTTGRAAGPV